MDRPVVRLHVTQRVHELLRVDTIKKLNVASGETVEFDAPNVRKASLTGTVDLPDTGAVLMPDRQDR